MDMYPPSDHELTTLDHITFTSDDHWDPTSLDNEPVDEAYIPSDPDPADLSDLPPLMPVENDSFDNVNDNDNDNFSNDELNLYRCLLVARPNDFNTILTSMMSILPSIPDFTRLRPYFGWANPKRIEETIRHTTQWFRAEQRNTLRKHFKTRFPAANVPRLNEKVASDTFFADTPALDDGIRGHGGATMAQLYVGKTSHLTEAFPMSSQEQVPQTILDFINQHGAPDVLLSDNAKAFLSHDVADILRHYRIQQNTSEPYYQHQNLAERRIQDIKRRINALLDRTGSPDDLWLLCLEYVVYLENRLSLPSNNGRTPLEVAHGQVPDISALLAFRWYEPVYYHHPVKSFPSTSDERLGYWVGIAPNVGDALTYLILDAETRHVVPRSVVRSATTTDPNYRAVPSTSDDGESKSEPPAVIQSVTDMFPPDIVSSDVKVPAFSPEELIGKSFIHSIDDGTKFKATVTKKIGDMDAKNHQNIKFLIDVGDGGHEDIISYVELCDLVEEQEQKKAEGDSLHAYEDIVGHEGPLKPTDDKYKGSKYNVKIKWNDGTTTMEPLSLMIKDDPITCAIYAKQHNLLNKPGWKPLRPLARRYAAFISASIPDPSGRTRSANKAHLHNLPVYKFGVQVPQSIRQAISLDKANNNHRWRDAANKEVDQLDEYEVFEDLGLGAPPPEGYQKISVKMIFDVKHDLRRKGRLVGGGHLTEPNKDESYSGVISLRALRLAITLGELNGLKIMVGDIGNAYLEAYTKEKVYIIAGPEFGEREGHTLVIRKALYGLRSSGARFHDRLADTLRDMGFTPCKSEPDLWMRDRGDHYEYVCVYVDDLMAIMKEPQTFFDELQEVYKYKLKGVGPPKYHLGGDFFRDPDGTLAWGAKSYIGRMMDNYKSMFGGLPHMAGTPLVANDSPELDQSHDLDQQGVRQYQSLIGALQWCITLGRFDISNAVMTMSRFRSQPKQGHLERVQRICGYLRKHPEGAIRFRTGRPRNEECFKVKKYDWEQSVYGNTKEETDPHAPEPKGRPVRLTTMVDANLYHCKVTGKAVTGILHILNQTPVDWWSKRQATVETATYGSEFVAAKTATDQIIALRTLLRDMGAPIDGPAWMLGDNESVVTSSTTPMSVLNKRHNALAYHRVRSNIAAETMYFSHISGKSNSADILTKPLAHTAAWPHVQPLLFCRGDTLPLNTSPIGECQLTAPVA